MNKKFTSSDFFSQQPYFLSIEALCKTDVRPEASGLYRLGHARRLDHVKRALLRLRDLMQRREWVRFENR